MDEKRQHEISTISVCLLQRTQTRGDPRKTSMMLVVQTRDSLMPYIHLRRSRLPPPDKAPIAEWKPSIICSHPFACFGSPRPMEAFCITPLKIPLNSPFGDDMRYSLIPSPVSVEKSVRIRCPRTKR